MDQRERQVIDELFGKLHQVERQAPQRDAEAEAHIRQQVSGLPAAPYYMAQAILVQEQALANMQTRVQELERQLAERPAASSVVCSEAARSRRNRRRSSRWRRSMIA
jgi:uncharacterized protein